MKREVEPSLLGLLALDPFVGTTSSARGAMFASHVGQAPVMIHNEPRRIVAGVEAHYADHTFDVRAPADITILDVIPRYPVGIASDTIRHNPLTTIIYEEYYSHTKTIGVIHVPDYNAFHQDFGFRYYKNKEVWERIAPGSNIGKDEVLAASSAVKESGLYGLVNQAEVAFMSDPGCIEDGFVVCEEYLDRLSPTVYNTHVASAGQKTYLLNLYGDDKVYKPFPDIGEPIRADGLVMAMRDLNEDLSPAEMTSEALRTVDHTFDRCVWGKAGSVVKDITVWRDQRVYPSGLPTGMDTQLIKYNEAAARYYQKILEVYNRLAGRRKKNLHTTPEFDQLVVDALRFLPAKDGVRKLTRMHRLEVLDEYRVEVVTETVMRPNLGFKLTDPFGGQQ